MNGRPVAPGLLAEDSPPRLIGGRHRRSGRMVFPMPADIEAYEAVPLPRTGTLWSYTVQRFEPKRPPYEGASPFEPFAVGYVELPKAVIVESRLTEVKFDALRIGMPMELVTMPLRTDPDGTTVLTFAFRPEQSASA
jgi:uncharacterized protein